MQPVSGWNTAEPSTGMTHTVEKLPSGQTRQSAPHGRSTTIRHSDNSAALSPHWCMPGVSPCQGLCEQLHSSNALRRRGGGGRGSSGQHLSGHADQLLGVGLSSGHQEDRRGMTGKQNKIAECGVEGETTADEYDSTCVCYARTQPTVCASSKNTGSQWFSRNWSTCP